MLPDLVLSAVLNGAPREFLARDVPAGVFLAGFEESVPGTDCFARVGAAGQVQLLMGLEAWADRLLTRVMLDPLLTPELVQRLGSARDELVLAYLWAVGWQRPPDHERRIPPRAAEAAAIGGLAGRALLESFAEVPGANLKTALRELASKCRVAPHVIWTQWSISEFIWTWRVILEDQLKKRGQRAPSGSDLMDQIGREPFNPEIKLDQSFEAAVRELSYQRSLEHIS